MQYRLRTLLIAVLVVSLGLAPIASRITRRRATEAAELAIMRIGGATLAREFGDCVQDDSSTTSALYDSLFGKDTGSEIYVVSLRDSKLATDGDIRTLRAFPSLGMLDLGNTSVTDACIADLLSLHNLVWLDITDTRITEAGARRLRRGFPNCEIHTEADE